MLDHGHIDFGHFFRDLRRKLVGIRLFHLFEDFIYKFSLVIILSLRLLLHFHLSLVFYFLHLFIILSQQLPTVLRDHVIIISSIRVLFLQEGKFRFVLLDFD